jgi:ERCC4-related helicase
MTPTRQIALTQDFEAGRLKKVIATPVWNVGVSFNQLAVLIRADAGSSAISDIQIPGRVSRISADKAYGVIHDYRDEFDSSFAHRARGRAKIYESNGWAQYQTDESGR